jgi:DNA-binding NarL/FixJ family response regulator
MRIRVSIIEDDAAYREALATVLRGTPGYACVAVHANAEDAIANLDCNPADVTLVDISLPGLSGIEFLRRFKARHPEALAVMLTVFEETEQIFRSLSAGADGYLLKSTPLAAILQGIGEVARGGAPMSGAIARQVLRYFHKSGGPRRELLSLTRREREVLEQLATGQPLKLVSASLGVSLETLHSHLRSIYRKLHVHSRSEAVARGYPPR